MPEEYVEWAQLSGKTIQTVRIYKDTCDGTTRRIEVKERISSTCCHSNQSGVQAALYRGGVGTRGSFVAMKSRYSRVPPGLPLFLGGITLFS